jgi:putative ABC transport system permease protein
MKYLPYILKHLRKTWIRTGSTVLGMALCIFLICVLQTVAAAINNALAGAATNRLVTRHRVSLVFPLPQSHQARIQSVPGVKIVARSNWFGGMLGSGGTADFKNFFPNFAVDAEPYFAMHPEFTITPDQMQAFLADRRGAVVGPELAEKFNWKIGSTFQLTSIIPPYQVGHPFDFVVRAIYHIDQKQYPGGSNQLMLFHYTYLYEATNQRAGVGTFNILIANANQASSVAKAIDAQFENSDNETKTETEQAFLASFVAQAGPLVFLLNFIGMAVAFTILLVTANTMSMAVRERRKEIAVLKTLGFSSRKVLSLVLGEALTLGIIGGLLGVGLAMALISNLAKIPGLGTALQTFPNISLNPTVTAVTFIAAAALGVCAGLIPAVSAFRSNITSMLRTV